MGVSPVSRVDVAVQETVELSLLVCGMVCDEGVVRVDVRSLDNDQLIEIDRMSGPVPRCRRVVVV